MLISPQKFVSNLKVNILANATVTSNRAQSQIPQRCSWAGMASEYSLNWLVQRTWLFNMGRNGTRQGIHYGDHRIQGITMSIMNVSSNSRYYDENWTKWEKIPIYHISTPYSGKHSWLEGLACSIRSSPLKRGIYPPCSQKTFPTRIRRFYVAALRM